MDRSAAGGGEEEEEEEATFTGGVFVCTTRKNRGRGKDATHLESLSICHIEKGKKRLLAQGSALLSLSLLPCLELPSCI
jgi:hypothetical protein